MPSDTQTYGVSAAETPARDLGGVNGSQRQTSQRREDFLIGEVSRAPGLHEGAKDGVGRDGRHPA